MSSRAAFVDQGGRLLSALIGLVRGRPFDGHHRRRRPSARRLGFEPLEARQLLSTVSITAPDPLAAEYGRPAPDNGLFRISRDAASTDPLIVLITRSGTAATRADFTALPTSVVIPASQTYVDVPVVVVNDLVNESTETVILTLKASTGYTLDADLTKRTATVTIADARPVQFSDPDLTAAVRATLVLSSTYPVLQSDMPRLTTLTADANRIDSLRGLEFATDLQTLNIVPGDFSLVQQRKTSLDLLPIRNLKQLSSVSLEGLGLANGALSALNKLPAIRSVDLRYNKISAPEGLASNRNLQDLLLYGNPLTNVGSLKGKFLNTDLQPVGLDQADTVAKLAKAFNYLPLKIYEYLLDNFSYQLYSGLMKGPQAALDTQAGSTLELANLLAELFHACGVTTRFVDGRVEADVQSVMDWLGVKSADAAFDLLLGNPEKILDGSGAIVGFRFGKYWLQASVPQAAGPNKWVDFDPSWKVRDYQPGVSGIVQAVPFDTAAENDYLSQVRKETTAEWYESRVAAYLAANRPGVSLADIPYTGPIHQQIITRLPTLPFTVVGTPTTFTEITPQRIQRVDLTFQQGTKVLLHYRMNVPDVCLKRITIDFAWTNSKNLVPQIRLDGKVVAKGIGPLVYGSQITLTIGHLNAGDDLIDSSHTYGYDAGEYAAIGIDALQISEKFLARLQTTANQAAVAQINGQRYSTDEQVGAVLELGILKYFDDDNRQLAALGGLTGLVMNFSGAESGLAHCYWATTFTSYLQNPSVPSSEGPTLDIAGRAGFLEAIDGNQATRHEIGRLVGDNGSALEHATWEAVYDVASVSTIKSLQLAHERGIPVYQINSGNS